MKFSPGLRRHLDILALAALLAGLAACGGGGGGGGDVGGGGPPPPTFIATAADNLFPLDANTRRVYTASASTGTLVDRVTGTQVVAGGTGTVVATVDSTDGSEDSSVYLVGTTGVRAYAAAGADALDRAFDGVEVMRWPMQAGERFLQVERTVPSGEDFDGDGRLDNITVRSELTAVARESVSTGAGTFPDSLHQRQNVRVTALPSGGGTPVVIDFTVDEWYVPNIGLVKRTTLTAPVGGTPSTSTETLSAYRVGTRSSDSTAPTVAGVTPGTAPVNGGSVVVSAQFSKAMDAASLAATGTFTVVDSGGARIPGTVQPQAQGLRFVPAQTWASGSYTATVSAAALDQLGNALAAARSWSFTVDATAPGVVSVTPASEAVDVDLTSTVVLVFSEPPDPASVNASNVRLNNAGGGNAAVPLQLRIDGNRVTLTPTAALERNQVYAVSVSNVTDLAGNPLAQSFYSRFFTSQGRFATNQGLFPGWVVRAMAVGDVNGDGIADVLALGQTNMVTTEQGLLLRSGRSDGTLADLVRLDISALAPCRPNALAIGDLSGDGRADVVVNGGNCGTLVLTQTASGTLAVGPYLASIYSDYLRLADVDGDGRLDLVTNNAFMSRIEVWRQGAGGAFALARSIELGGPMVKHLELGDIDGDGRVDIVAAVGGTLGQHVAVLRQAADGSFGPPLILSTESPWGATAVALGDLNGDGRIDIVATTGGNTPTYLAVYYGAAGGAVGPLTRVPTFDLPYAVRVADVDGDGRADIVVSHDAFSAVGVHLQLPAGTLAAEERFRAPSYAGSTNSLVVADINRDGRPDILIAGDWLRQLPQGAGASSATPDTTALKLRLRGGLLRR